MDDDLHDAALGIALEAGAVERCFAHSYVWIDQGDSDANSHAYAIATIRWKSGSFNCERQELMDAIKSVIVQSAEECPACQKIRDE
jgi:hypothetical protein